MKKHFVTFYSPGTFSAETTERPVESWDTAAAVAMAQEIIERYGATPYGFRFSTRARLDDELDSQEVASSGMYYLGGEILTLEQVIAQNDPKNEILISNMKGNGYKRVIDNRNSWRSTHALNDEDVVLPFTPPKKAAAV